MNKERVFASNITVRLLNVLAVLGITVLLSRLLGVEGYGAFAFLVANVSLLNLVSGLGSDAGITYVTASGKLILPRINNLVYRIIVLQLLVVLLVEMVSWMAWHHSLLFPQTGRNAWWIAPLLLMAIAVSEKFNALLNGSHRYSLSSAIVVSSNLLLLVILIILYAGKLAKPPLFYIQLYTSASVLQAVLLVLAWKLLARQTLAAGKTDAADRKTFFSYSLVSFFSNVIQFIAYRVDYWILEYYRGSEELGWYSLAVRVAQLFWILPLLLAGIIFPAVAGRSGLFDVRRLLVLIRWMNLANVVAALAVWLLAPTLLPVVFGVAFTPSVALLFWLLPGVILFCMTTILCAYFAADRQLRFNFYTSLVCVSVITVLDLLLIPGYGMQGAAIASTIGYGTCSIFCVALFSFHYKVRWTDLLIPGAHDIRAIRKFVSITFQR